MAFLVVSLPSGPFRDQLCKCESASSSQILQKHLLALRYSVILFSRKDEAPVKGLQNLARQLLSASDNGSGEDGHIPSSHGHPGNARHRFQRDKIDDSGLSPVATFLLHRLLCPPRVLLLFTLGSPVATTRMIIRETG